MDPGTMMAIMSALSTVVGGLTGENGGQGSTYNKGQLGLLDQAINDIRGMKGGAQDITQNQGYQQGQNWLNSLFNDEDFFKNFEAPLQRQFQEQTIPELSNRFSGMGSGGAGGSTAFNRQLARESGNLHSNIAALRGGMQQQGVGQALQYAQQPFSNLMQLYQQALQPTQNTYQGPSQGVWGGLAAPFAQGAASYWGGQGGNQNNNSSSFQPAPLNRSYPGQY